MSKQIYREIHKNHLTQIRISKDEFRDKEYADIREFYLSNDNEFRPTRKGVKFSLDLLDEVIAGLNELRKNVRENQNNA